MLDRAYVESVSASSAFGIGTIEKVLRLLELLGDVDRHPLLSRVLALKGGTALNLFYGPPPRLSVDLDFNYVDGVDRTEMEEDRPEVERALAAIAEGRSYRIQTSAPAHAGTTYFLGYRAVTGIDDRIEVDLNLMHRVPVGDLVRRTAWSPDGESGPTSTLVSSEELFAGKFRAFMDRVAPRDAFDMARIPTIDGGTWHQPRTRAVAVALSGTLIHPLYRLSPRLTQVLTPSAVQEQLHPMLAEADRPDPTTLLASARAAVGPLIDAPTEPEIEYVERINRGELCPELLFPDDDELAARLRLHPALRWKAQNSRRHHGA